VNEVSLGEFIENLHHDRVNIFWILHAWHSSRVEGVNSAAIFPYCTCKETARYLSSAFVGWTFLPYNNPFPLKAGNCSSSYYPKHTPRKPKYLFCTAANSLNVVNHCSSNMDTICFFVEVEAIVIMAVLVKCDGQRATVAIARTRA